MNRTAAILRLATLSDVPSLESLINESVRALSADSYDREQIEAALRHVFGVDSQLIRDQTYFVAEVAGQIVGAGGWSKRNTLFGGDQSVTRDDVLLVPGKDAARLRAFYVHPNWARQGIGKLITGACEAAASAAGFTKAELIATLPGVPLYRAAGYESIAPFTITLPEGLSLPAFHMEKVLN